MNLESNPSKKDPTTPISDDFDFVFKPITSGLGFHHPKTEVKPMMAEKISVSQSMSPAPMKKEMNVYQNDLSLFYGQQAPATPVEAPKMEAPEVIVKTAAKSDRVIAYVMDLIFLTSVVGLVLTLMAKSIGMDLMEMWQLYPDEMTPLVATQFCGFYMIYFSIFETSSPATLGKNLMGLRVVNMQNRNLSFLPLLLRTFVTLLNILSLGLFSYFDLQNKIAGSKVIRKA